MKNRLCLLVMKLTFGKVCFGWCVEPVKPKKKAKPTPQKSKTTPKKEEKPKTTSSKPKQKPKPKKKSTPKKDKPALVFENKKK